MGQFNELAEPIVCDAYSGPTHHWVTIEKAKPPSRCHVVAFVKNFNLGFAIPYVHNGEAREYLPDFLARVRRTERKLER